MNKHIDNKCRRGMVARIRVGFVVCVDQKVNHKCTKLVRCLHKKDGYKEITCNVPTCVHKPSVRESMCSLVPVIVCKVGNLAEMNFTTGAGKADMMKWTSSNIQALLS